MIVAEAGQLVYVAPFAKHTLRALDEPARLFLSASLHIASLPTRSSTAMELPALLMERGESEDAEGIVI